VAGFNPVCMTFDVTLENGCRPVCNNNNSHNNNKRSSFYGATYDI